MRDIFYIYTFTLLIGACLVILKSDLELKKKLIICLGILAMCLVTEFMTAYIYPQCTNISEPESFRTRPSASTLNMSEEFTTTIFVPSPQHGNYQRYYIKYPRRLLIFRRVIVVDLLLHEHSGFLKCIIYYLYFNLIISSKN